MLHISCLIGYLEGVVSVQVETVGSNSGILSSSVNVLFGNENEEDIIENLIDVIYVIGDLIVLLDVYLAGFSVAILEESKICSCILYKIRNCYRSGCSCFTHLFCKLSFTFFSESFEILVVNLVFFDQSPSEFKYTVGSSNFVGVDVGVKNRDCKVIILTCFDLSKCSIRICLYQFSVLEPLINLSLVFCNDQIRHVTSSSGLTH